MQILPVLLGGEKRSIITIFADSNSKDVELVAGWLEKRVAIIDSKLNYETRLVEQRKKVAINVSDV